MKTCETLPEVKKQRATVVEAHNPEGIPEQVWPIDWGPLGLPSADSPYALAAEEHVVAEAKKQLDRRLRTDPTKMTMASLFEPVGGDAFRGFEIFRNSNELAIWRVPAPIFLAPDVPDCVQIVPPKAGYHHVVGALMLIDVCEYVVRDSKMSRAAS